MCCTLLCPPAKTTAVWCWSLLQALTWSVISSHTYFSGCFEAPLRVCPAAEYLGRLTWAGAWFLGHTCFTASMSSRRRNGKVQHCRIHSRQDAGAPKFFLTDNLVFDSLYDLITHYQQVPLRCNEFEMRLSEPVPQTNAHESKE